MNSRSISWKARPPRFVVEATASDFRRGVDVLKLNQLSDELEIEQFEATRSRDEGER